MAKTIGEIIARIENERKKLGITLYPPASYFEIAEFETKLSLKLPDDIKAFYLFCNGFESEEDMFRIIPLDEIVSCAKEYQSQQFYLAEYMIYCDMWTIEIGPNNSYKIYNHDKDREWLCLTNSFSEFLECFLNHGIFEADGLYDWHARVKITRG